MASVEKQIKTVRRSPLFDRKWYQTRYTDVGRSGIDPAYHYVLYGWKEDRDPSERFSTAEYFELNSDVKRAMLCPLYHYEAYGRTEGRRFRLDPDAETETLRGRLRNAVFSAKKSIRDYPQKVHYQMLRINPRKVLFATYQHQYVCNPKYICEELLSRNLPCEIVWLCKRGGGKALSEEISKSVRCVEFDSPEAAYEIATAKVLIENGILLFSQKQPKKRKQLNICTWHGSMGFKRIGPDTVKSAHGLYVAEMYGKVHDIVLTNSQFEDEIFRNSFWPRSELWRIGHPRNDILFQKDPAEIQRIRENVRRKLGVPAGYKFVLYAPTFREKSRAASDCSESSKCYEMNYQRIRSALRKRFGSDWVILVRHHYCNAQNKVLNNMITLGAVAATNYGDIQELMVAADVGITDYSSWILDFLLTGKPGFLFAADEDIYSAERGFYYALNTAPFPIAKDMDQLCEQIESFDWDNYRSKTDAFLKEKGCVEDGSASRHVVDRIEMLLKKNS